MMQSQIWGKPRMHEKPEAVYINLWQRHNAHAHTPGLRSWPVKVVSIAISYAEVKVSYCTVTPRMELSLD